jgi:hypothetical protein
LYSSTEIEAGEEAIELRASPAIPALLNIGDGFEN